MIRYTNGSVVVGLKCPDCKKYSVFIYGSKKICEWCLQEWENGAKVAKVKKDKGKE